jgi:hypothetical protein
MTFIHSMRTGIGAVCLAAAATAAALVAQTPPGVPPVRVPVEPVRQLAPVLRDLLAKVGKDVTGVQNVETLFPARPVGATGAKLLCEDALAVDTNGNFIKFRLTLPLPRVERLGYTPRCTVSFTPAAPGDYYVLTYSTASDAVLDFDVHRKVLPDYTWTDATRATRVEVAGGSPLASRRFRYAHVVGPASDRRDRMIVVMSASADPPPGTSQIRDREWYLLSADILRVMR